MRLRTIGILFIAATCWLQAHSQQQDGTNTEPPEAAAENPATPPHVVNPPKVSCRGNTLTISANYSRLGVILAELEKCTGVQFDAPEAVKASLIFDEIGPGPSSDVVASLLTSSGLDFVIGASASDPKKIEKVVLLARTEDKNSASPDPRASSPLRRAFAQMRETARPKTPEMQAAAVAEIESDGEDSSGVSQPAAAASAQDSSKSAASTSETPDPAAPNADAASAQPPQDTAGPAKSASPAADRIATMEKLFEQRRHMVQQSHAPQQPQP